MVHTLANGGKICCIYVGFCALSQGVLSNILYSFIVTSFMLRITLVRNDESVALKILREELFWCDSINPLNPELNPIYYLLTLLGAHHFLYVSRIRVKSSALRLLMLYIYIYIYIYIYGAPILDVARSHTTTHHSR